MSYGLKAELRDLLPEDLLQLVPRSFDIIGSKQKAVAIIELQERLTEHEDAIAAAIMSVHKNVTSVLVKESERTGEYRTRELRLVAGDPNTEVLHKESGCVFRLDPRIVYFSPRECAERERISTAVTDGENVLVMFSGVGPLPICIARRHRNVRATAIELNPNAHNYCVENIYLNKVEDRVRAIRGDVRKVCKDLGRTYDRILMPLPKGAYRFLDLAMTLLKDEGILHFYYWAPEGDPFSEAEELVKGEAKEKGRRAEFINRIRVSQYSPRVWKVRLDVRISIHGLSSR
jgi:tRNA (guanine37-N1)-methyltransferase